MTMKNKLEYIFFHGKPHWMLFSKEELAVLDNTGYKKGYAKKLVFERFLEAFPGMEPTINRGRKVLYDKNLRTMVDVCYSEDGNRMTAYNEYRYGVDTFDGIIRLCIDMTKDRSDPIKYPWFDRWNFREYFIYGRELTWERLRKIHDDLEFVFAKGLSEEELLEEMIPLKELLSTQTDGRDYEYFRSQLIRDECSSTAKIFKETIDSYEYIFADDNVPVLETFRKVFPKIDFVEQYRHNVLYDEEHALMIHFLHGYEFEEAVRCEDGRSPSALQEVDDLLSAYTSDELLEMMYDENIHFFIDMRPESKLPPLIHFAYTQYIWNGNSLKMHELECIRDSLESLMNNRYSHYKILSMIDRNWTNMPQDLLRFDTYLALDELSDINDLVKGYSR